MQFKRIIPFLILFLFAFTANLSFAQSSEENTFNPLGNSLGVTLEGGGVYPHTDIDPEINYLYRGGLEYFFPTSDAHAFGIKLMGGFVNLGKQDQLGDVKLGLMYALGTGGTIPYLSLGGNYIFQKDVKEVEQNSFGYFGEAGLKFFLGDALTLNLSYTLNLAGHDKLEGVVANKNDAYSTAQAGFTFFLSQDLDSDNDGVRDSKDMCPDTPMGVKVDEFGCPLDGDKDGVADYLDRCPDTPAGVQVDSEGCPVDSDGDGVADYLDKCPNTPKNVKVDKNGCPVDTDGDGVADYLDKCPNTPKDVKVDKEGCPVDTDGDGVPDYLDKCPNTPKGTKVDNHGCPEVVEAFKVTVYFGFDKSNLTKEATAKLDGAADFLKRNPETMFSLEGHTCWIGPESYNMKLSERRANSVFNYIVKKGIDKQRFQKKWFGETMPAADNKIKEGRKLNRRTLVIQMLEK